MSCPRWRAEIANHICRFKSRVEKRKDSREISCPTWLAEIWPIHITKVYPSQVLVILVPEDASRCLIIWCYDNTHKR